MARILATSAAFEVAGARTLAATQARLVAVAKARHAAVMAAPPRPQAFRRYVDGRAGAPEEAVRPHGVIVYEYPRIALVGQFALETLRKLSPVRSGDYKESHIPFLNGEAIPDGEMKNWRPGDELSIANVMPYARKIEVGGMKMRVPGTDHVYGQAHRIVRGRYGNLCRIEFTFRIINWQDLDINSADKRFPTLIIRER